MSMPMWRGMNPITASLAALALCALVAPSVAAPTGRIVIAGYGPELPVMQDLALAFEKTHVGTAVDFRWDKTVKAAEMVKSDHAQVAVSDTPDDDLKTMPIAWDGIAIIVNFSNSVKELTTSQVRDLFIGKITRWSDLDGGDQRVEVLLRAREDNVQSGLESSLQIVGGFRAPGKPVRTDEKALRTVSGRDTAITAISLATALKAQEDGIPIRILTVDKVEPGFPTVRSGQYKLRRPVLLLTAHQPDAVTTAFIEFATSAKGQHILQSAFVPYAPATADAPGSPARVTDGLNLTPENSRS
jgi:phosphate transport system substrate-binding protein